MQHIRLYFSKILNTIFPPKCYGCHRKNTPLCDECLQKCAKSIDTPAIYITSLYSFKDPLIKRVIHAIKYYHRRDLIEPIVERLAEKLQETSSLKQGVSNADSRSESDLSDHAVSYKLQAVGWTFVPISMPKLRKYIRGYNQAELIARELSKKCNISYDSNLLVRTRSPKRQVKTSTRGERLQNQSKSFKVTSDVSSLNIILVDDVTTTGATIAEARKVLLKAGARSVKAITIAH